MGVAGAAAVVDGAVVAVADVLVDGVVVAAANVDGVSVNIVVAAADHLVASGEVVVVVSAVAVDLGSILLSFVALSKIIFCNYNRQIRMINYLKLLRSRAQVK